MGNAGIMDIGCTPTLAGPGASSGCAPSLASAAGCTPSLAGSKGEECFDPCTPSLAGRALDPLSDQECADIALVQATVRGEARDVVRALSLGAHPNTIAELTLRMGEPSKKGRRGRAVHVTPLMRACEMGHEDITLLLLRAKASALQCDSHGWTALCHALGAGEVSCGRLVVQQSGVKLRPKQKEICRKLEAEILEKCRTEATQEQLADVQRELGPGGLLDETEDCGGFCEVDSTAPMRSVPDEGVPVEAAADSGAEPTKVHPLVCEVEDLINLGTPYSPYDYPGTSPCEYPQTTGAILRFTSTELQ